jgi:hypothetical protein
LSDSEDDGDAAEHTGPTNRLELVSAVPLTDLPTFFDSLQIDLHPVGTAKCSEAKVPPFLVSFTGRGLPESKDIRGRVLSVARNPEADASVVEKAVVRRANVYRIQFRCRGYEGH